MRPYMGTSHDGDWVSLIPSLCKLKYPNIYDTGAAKYVVGEEEDRLTLADTLVSNQKGSNMFTRMGKNE